MATAATLFLEAKALQPEDEQALSNEALAYFITEDWPKAQQLTEELRKKYQHSARIHMVWIHTAARERTVEELKADIPPVLLQDAEVCSALAARAMFDGRFDMAEQLAITAGDSKPDWSYPRGLKGQALVLRILSEHDVVDAELGGGVLDGLKEAERCFDNAVALATAERAIKSRAEALILRAHVRRILHHDPEADEDIFHAYGIAPEVPSVVLAIADVEERRGNLDKAVSLLRGIASGSSRPNIQIRLATSLRKRDSGNDRHEASELLLDVARSAANFPMQMRKHVYGMAVESLLAGRRYEDANTFCKELANVNSLQLLSLILQARVALDTGAEGSARELTDAALSSTHATSDREDVRYLANLFDRMGRFADALKLWQQVARVEELDADTKSLMNCAARLGRDDVVLETCRAQFGDHAISLRDSLMLLASFLVHLYREPVLPQTREAVAVALFESFAQRPGAISAIARLRQLIPQLFGLNAVGAIEATRTMEAWLSTKEVVL